VLFVSQFLFSEGATADESGSLIYYRTLGANFGSAL
jgi:hypothetical protein